MKILIHADNEVVHDLIDGRLYSLEPKKPFKVESDHIAGLILAHKHYHGIVEVKATETETGIVYATDEAVKLALETLEAKELERVNAWVNSQYDDRIQNNKPPLAPPPAIQAIIDKRGIDLKRDYNLTVPRLQMGAAVQGDVLTLRNENQALREDLGRLQSMVEQLLAAQTAGSGNSKPAKEK